MIYLDKGLSYSKNGGKGVNYCRNYRPLKWLLQFINYCLNQLTNKYIKTAVNLTIQFFQSHYQIWVVLTCTKNTIVA